MIELETTKLGGEGHYAPPPYCSVFKPILTYNF